jgi:hypothetical protein
MRAINLPPTKALALAFPFFMAVAKLAKSFFSISQGSITNPERESNLFLVVTNLSQLFNLLQINLNAWTSPLLLNFFFHAFNLLLVNWSHR